MAFNMKRKKELDNAKAMSNSLYPGVEHDEIALREVEEANRKYIYEEIDAEEFSKLISEIADRELERGMASKGENK